MTKKVCVVVGTRPEAIKMAPVYRQLLLTSGIEPILLSTGQHREMLAQTLDAFGLKPDEDLGLMRPSQTLADLTTRAITALTDYFQKSKPDAVLVQGDTTSVLASSMAAFYENIPIGHVEAGLRTGNMRSPWPEEMNRRLTSPLCSWNFAPTERSRSNLLAEGIPTERCFVTGNTVIDALFWMKNILDEKGVSSEEIARSLNISNEFRDRYLSNECERFILVTGHRRESFGQGFEDLCSALLRVVSEHKELGILFPVHLNPAVREVVKKRLSATPRIELIEPVGYENFVWLMSRCFLIVSDSGGVQEEAPSFGKPVLVTRETTERPEGVDAGTSELVGTDVEQIVSRVDRLMHDSYEYQRRSILRNPYGDGNASQRICDVIATSTKLASFQV